MTVFNAILKILKRNAPNLLIGLAITIGVSMLMSGDLNKQLNGVSQAKVAILGAQKSEASKDFVTFMGEQQELVNLKETDEKSLDDALYFGKVDYILWLPTDFQEQLVKGAPLELAVETRPGTYSKTLVDTSVNQFINTYHDLNVNSHEDSYQGPALMNILAEQGTVHYDQSADQKTAREAQTVFYNILAYGMFMSIFNGYGAINLVFNRKEISERNRLAPISRRSLSRKISLAALVYSLVVVAIFLLFVTTFTKAGFDQMTGLYLLNTACFSFTIISFSIFVTSLVKNPETLSGVSNVFILGTSFIGGVFVSSNMMPVIVNKIAAFTPTYWFTQSNDLISQSMTYGSSFFNEYWLNCLIICLFGAVFLLLHHLSQGEWQLFRKAVAERE